MNTSTKFKRFSHTDPYVWFRPLASTMANKEIKAKLQALKELYPPETYLPNEYKFALGCLELADAAQMEHDKWLATECENPDYRKVAYEVVAYVLAGLEVFAEHGHGEIYDDLTPTHRSEQSIEEGKTRAQETAYLLSYAGRVADDLYKDALEKNTSGAFTGWLPEAEAIARLGLMVVETLSWCWGYPSTAEPATLLAVVTEWNERLAKIQRAIAQYHEAQANEAKRLCEIRNASLKQFRKAGASLTARFISEVKAQADNIHGDTAISAYESIAIPPLSDGSFKGQMLHMQIAALVADKPRYEGWEKYAVLLESELLATWFWNCCNRLYPHPASAGPEEIIAYLNEISVLIVKANGRKFYLTEVRCNIWVSDDNYSESCPQYPDYVDYDPNPVVLRPDVQSVDEMIALLPTNTDTNVDFAKKSQVHVYLENSTSRPPYFPVCLFKLVGVEATGGMIKHLVYEARLQPAVPRMSEEIIISGKLVKVLVGGRQAPIPDITW
jgi:hypothetical protein